MDRNLLRALALSLAVHGLALSPFARPPAGSRAAPLVASLRQPAPHPPAPLPKAPPPPSPPVASSVRTPLPAPAAQKPEARPEPAPVAAPVPVEAGDSQAPPAVAAPASQAAIAEHAEAAQAAPRPIDMDGLRQYHMALGRMAARFRRYPPQARADGQEGRVPLRLTISEAGLPVGLSLIGTSGFASLDQAALEMIGLAAGHTPIPESLRGQSFSIDLAVDYNLRDAQ